MAQRGIFCQLVAGVILVTLFPGCISRHSLGIRPDLPGAVPSDTAYDSCNKYLSDESASHACADFSTIVDWSNALEESYRSRATLNEWSVYFAGAIALATISTSAALAAVNTAKEALTLLPIAGGFSSAFFAFLDNKSKGEAYMQAANAIAAARSNARACIETVASKVGNSAGPNALTEAYHVVTGYLYRQVTEARNALEMARKGQLTDAALKRLADEVKQLRDELKGASHPSTSSSDRGVDKSSEALTCPDASSPRPITPTPPH